MTFAKEIFRQAKDQARMLFCTINVLCDNTHNLSEEQKLLNQAASYALQALGCLFDSGKIKDEDSAEGES